MTSAIPINMPGTIPAMKSCVIDTFAATPKTMNAIDGGMTGAIIPPEAMRPAERGTLYPALAIIGMRIAARAAVSAAADPEMLAMITAAMMATMPRPPLICPTQAMANSMMRRDKPPEFINSPARTKNGIASSVNVSAPAIMFCAMIWLLNMPMYHMSVTPQNISAKATGTPMAMAPRREVMKTRRVIRRAPPAFRRPGVRRQRPRSHFR
jgi:hypothetical protein